MIISPWEGGIALVKSTLASVIFRLAHCLVLAAELELDFPFLGGIPRCLLYLLVVPTPGECITVRSSTRSSSAVGDKV